MRTVLVKIEGGRGLILATKVFGDLVAMVVVFVVLVKLLQLVSAQYVILVRVTSTEQKNPQQQITSCMILIGLSSLAEKVLRRLVGVHIALRLPHGI